MGVFTTLERLIDELVAEWERWIRTSFTWQDPITTIENRIKLVYGRGDITREEYFQLKSKLAKGQLGQGDLDLLESRLSGQNDSGLAAKDPQVSHSLQRLHLGKAHIEDARVEAELALQGLEKDLQALEAQAASAGELAQAALPDEAGARQLLEVKHRLLERAETLRARARSLQHGLARLDLLQKELQTSETELNLLASEMQIAGLEAYLRETLVQTYPRLP